MVIRFKKLHTISNKVYISFDNEKTYFEFNTEDLDPAGERPYILFGKGTENEKAYIEFFRNKDEGILSIECEAIPESLSDIKIFGRDINEVWTPKFTHQRKLAYDNESPETIYINYEQNPNAFKEYLESENTNTDLKVYNIYGDQEFQGFTYKMDLADQFRDTLKESGKTVNLGASVLPPRRNYNNFFAGMRNLIYGPELPDAATDAEAMYKNSSIRRPISLAGSLVKAKEIFKDSNIRSLPKEFGDSLKDISYAFENCNFDNPDLSGQLLGKNIEEMEGSFKGSNIRFAPQVPDYISNLDSAFESCHSLEEIPSFANNKADEVSLQSTFRSCSLLGKHSNGISGLPSTTVNMNGTFADCESLTRYAEALPANVRTAQATFENCVELRLIPAFNKKVENIQRMFYNCSLIEIPQKPDNSLVYLPASIKNMDGAFFGTQISRTPNMKACENLESMREAFYNCPRLYHVDEINRFAPLKSVMNAFDGKSRITQFPNFPLACEDDLSWKFSVGESDKSINNFDSLQKIGSIESKITGFIGAFKNASSLKEVGQISLNNIPSIDSSFQNCTSLETSPYIKIFGNETSGKYLFAGCSSIEKINNFPKCTSLEGAFQNCVKVTGRDIASYKSDLDINSPELAPLPVEYDSDKSGRYVDVLNMFQGCTNLKEVTFPRLAFNPELICGGVNNSVEIINQLPDNLVDEAQIKTLFNNFPNVQVVRKAPRVQDISGWFTGNKKLISCAFDEDNAVIRMNDTFNGCENLRNTLDIYEVDDLNNRTDIEVCRLVADRDYSKFKVFVPSHVESMIRAFKNCKQISEIDEIPESVQFAQNSFEGCSSLQKIGKILSIRGDFTSAFKDANVKEIGLISSPKSVASITLNGSGVEDTLETVGEVNGEILSHLFENCRKLSTVSKMPETLVNADSTFKGCSSLKSIPNRFKTTASNLVSTFEGSAIEINESNYETFFDGNVPSLTATFKNCSNVTVAPSGTHNSEVVYDATFENCVNLEKASLESNVSYQNNCFAGDSNLSELLFVSQGAKFSNTIFDDKEKLKKIKNLEFNPSYSMSGISFKAEEAESIVTEEGKLFEVIDSAIETPTSVIYKVYGSTETEALLNATKEAEKYNGKVLPAIGPMKVTIPVEVPLQVEVVNDGPNINGESNISQTVEMISSTATFYYRNVEVTSKNFDISKKKLSEYIQWLYDEGYIYTTQYITEENVSSTVYSYFSKLGDYFPHIEEVEQISARNSSGIFACGNVLKLNSDNILEENGLGDIMGPTTLKRVTGKPGEGIATSEVSNMSHAFFKNTSIEYVGDIPSTITSMDKPFEGCTGLKEVGNVEANVLSYTELFKDCTSLEKTGKIGKFSTVTSSLEKAFSGCSKLTEVGGIYGDIENFRQTFENCTSLQTIKFLSTDTFKNAQLDKNNITGMFIGTADKITIHTEAGHEEELKQLLLDNAETIRNKPEKDKRGNTIYKYNFDNNGIGHPYSKSDCEAWVSQLTIMSN